MKFFVVVNHTHLLLVDAETNGGAEHKLLDRFHYYINQCQAFKLDETKVLFEMFPDVQTSSMYQLEQQNLSAEYQYCLNKIKEYENRANVLKQKIGI